MDMHMDMPFPVNPVDAEPKAETKSKKSSKKRGGLSASPPPPAERNSPRPPAETAPAGSYTLEFEGAAAAPPSPAKSPAKSPRLGLFTFVDPAVPVTTPRKAAPTAAAGSRLAAAVVEQYAGAYASARQQAVATLEPYVARAADGIVYIKVKVGDYFVIIKARIVESSVVKGAIKRLEPIAIKIKAIVEPKVLLAKAKLGDVAVFAKGKSQIAIEAYSKTQRAIDEFAKVMVTKLAAQVSNAKLMAIKFSEPVTIRAKGGYVYVSGAVGGTIVSIRAKRDSTKAMALEGYAGAVAKVGSYVTPAIANIADKCGSVKVKALGIVRPYYVKVQDGFANVKGKIGDADVFIRAKVSNVVAKAGGAVEPFVMPLYVKVQDGYLYIVGKVDGTIVYIRATIVNTYDCTKVKALATYQSTLKIADGYIAPVASQVVQRYRSAKSKALCIADQTTMTVKAKAAAVSASVKTAAADQKYQATAAAATSGAVALGASAGAAGFVTGGTIGAAIGVVPALFTFGLSIPIGAAIGASMGTVVGTAAGGTVGLVGGGAVGYGVQTHKKEIGNGFTGAMSKASAAKDYVQGKATTGSTLLKSKMIGTTGGTA